MIQNLKNSIFFIWQNAGYIDFLAYGWSFLCFLLIFFVGIFLASRWSWQVGFLLIFVGFFAFLSSPYFINQELNSRLRPVKIEQKFKKQLEFSDTLLLEYELTNLSKQELNSCKIDIKFHKNSKSSIKNYANSLSPFLTKTILIKEPIASENSKLIKATINNFAFVDYNISVRTECF